MKFSLAFVSALLVVASATPSEDNARAPQACTQRADARPFYRAYNGAVIDHLYALRAAEMQSAASLRYNTQGPIPSYIVPFREPGTVPLYRLFRPSIMDHFYTTSAAEHNAAIGLGYNSEGIVGYTYPNVDYGSGPGPLYSSYNLAPGRDRFYATSASERRPLLVVL